MRYPNPLNEYYSAILTSSTMVYVCNIQAQTGNIFYES